MKVAIVEDTSTMISLWTRFLKGSEHQGIFLSSSLEDLVKLQSFAPEVIICPGVPRYQTAFNLLTAIRSSPQTSRTPLIVSTSLDECKVKETWNLDSVDALLIKPFTQTKLLALLDQFEVMRLRSQRDIPLAVIVDDSQVARSVLTAEMENLGFSVETASDGNTGLHLITQLLPDIALVDIEMPGKSGLEICAHLSSSPKTSRIPILVVSGTVSDSEMRRGFTSGAIDFLAKPVDSCLLARAVSTVMEKGDISHKRRALLLESDRSVSAIMVKLLTELGIASIISQTIEEFRDYLAVSVPDLVSLSLSMPKEKLIQLCCSLREDKILKNIPIIVISNAEERETLIPYLQSGANEVIQRPFTREEFQARIANILNMKRIHDELILQNRALQDLAYYDPLTGLLNRRYLEAGLTRELNRAQRAKEPLGFLLMDLDHFKQKNDAYGHEVGDEILKEIATLIKNDLRSIDIPCRYGGEEICVLLPGCSLLNAEKIAERLRIACENARFTSLNLQQTLSAGVTAYPPSQPEGLIADADQALYKAKSKGRNCVVVCHAE